MKIMERKYIAKNGVVERTRFAVGDRVTPRTGRKKGNTSARQQEKNLQTAVRKLGRILNNNYSERSLLITLDYSEEGLEQLIGKLEQDEQAIIRRLQAPVGEVGSWQARGKAKLHTDALGAEIQAALNQMREAAEHQVNLYLRRIGRKIRHKAVWVTADIDGETGEVVRIHHHIALCPEEGQDVSWDLLRKQWRLGGIDIKTFHGADYTPLAAYLLRQVRHQPDAKKYSCSRGFEQPRMEERIVLSAQNEIRTPAGAKVLERQYSDEHVAQYVRYIPRRGERRKCDGISEDPGNQREL